MNQFVRVAANFSSPLISTATNAHA